MTLHNMPINTQMDAAHAELASIMNAAPIKDSTADNPFVEGELMQTEGDIGGTPL